MRRLGLVAGLLTLAGCAVSDSYEGARCVAQEDCPTGYACDLSKSVCTTGDAGLGGGAATGGGTATGGGVATGGGSMTGGGSATGGGGAGCGTGSLLCGGTCAPCFTPLHATPVCSGSSCGFTCDEGYARSGQECLDINECLSANGGCHAAALCTNTPGSHTCACNAGYAGDGVVCADINECLTSNGGCDAQATCTNTPGGRTCACNGGYAGDGVMCTDINECLTANGGCHADAVCTNTPGSRTCACNNGYAGNGLACTDINECLTSNGGCAAQATCTNTPGSHTCACSAGYAGDGLTCADINECLTSNGGCAAQATCTNTAGSHTCACSAGYAGDGVTCTDINECLTSNGGCAATATCTNTPGSRTCACNAGYAGDGATCTDINECLSANGGCAAQASCTNTPGTRTCACNAGYAGDGVVCADINECLTGNGGCDSLTTCTNTTGSRTCSACPTGYTGTGATGCVDINECLSANGGCQVNAVCSNTPGGRTCACAPGYTGDGVSCVWNDTALSNLAVTPGVLSFIPSTLNYAVEVATVTFFVEVTATAPTPAGVSITINGQAVASGVAQTVTLSTSAPITITVVAASGAQRTYSVLVLRGLTAQQAWAKASNTGAGDYLGVSVALSSDGNTLAVGASGEDSAATGVGGNQADNTAGNSGAVYVYTRTGVTWTQQAYVKASNTGASDGFGGAVSLSADGNTLAVSATGEASAATGVGGNQTDNSARLSGAVYVFVRTGTVWAQQAYVKASNTESSDCFGCSVSLSGDGSTLAVGAFAEDSAATGVNGAQADNAAGQSGAVYVYARTGSVWAQQAYVKASNTEVDDYFGSSVSLSGDGSTLAVGALGEDSAATGINANQANNSAGQSGAVYVYMRTGTVWAQQAYVKASNPEYGDVFGASVSLSGNGNTLSVGAPSEGSAATGVGGSQTDNSALNSGAVYVYARNGATWAQQTYVKASNTGPNDAFGTSVSLSADGSTLAVGAQAEASVATGVGGNGSDNSAISSGAVYVYAFTGTTWAQRAYVKASNTGASDQFGHSAALSADGSTLAVGAIQEDSAATGVGGNQADNSAVDSGAVYVFTH